MADQHEQGQFIQADFFNNAGGVNLTDSPIRVLDEQATGGYNYEYGLTGGFRKRLGHTKLSASPDAQLRHLGSGIFVSSTNVKSNIRAGGRKLQLLTLSNGALTNLTEDTLAVNSDFIPSSVTIPALFTQFDTAAAKALWVAGASMTGIYGVTSTTKATKNGVPAPTGTISGSEGGSSGVWATSGNYFYAVAFRKASTVTFSNASLDVSVTLTDKTKKITLDLTTLTGVDTTKYDKILIYRSAVNGSTAFTTGDLVTTINSSVTSYVDDGSSSASAQNVPRIGNIVLDNGVLPSGTFNCLTNFKRRLVTAIGDTLYFSEVNKPEAWPLTNSFPVPSGGPITGVAVISFSTPTTSATDEFLVVFKEAECWVVTGSDYTTWSLKKIDSSGCTNQALAVNANGYLLFMDYRGIYIWDGSGKPIYASRPIEYQFSPDGTLDKSKLTMASGTFHKKTNQVIWTLSDTILGENCYSIKMDLRLTLPNIETSLQGRVVDAIFIQDSTTFPIYAAQAGLPTYDETVIGGDASGYVYKLYDSTSDASSGIAFSYTSKIFDLGKLSETKRIHKVIVWLEDSSDALLTLNYWVGYNINASEASSQTQPISKRVTRALWDLAYWDAANWDSSVRTYSPVVYNLNSIRGAEGDAMQLQFVQTGANAPVSIAGFSIIYSLAGLRK